MTLLSDARSIYRKGVLANKNRAQITEDLTEFVRKKKGWTDPETAEYQQAETIAEQYYNTISYHNQKPSG